MGWNSSQCLSMDMQISPKTRRPIEVRFRHYMKLQDGGGMPVLC